MATLFLSPASSLTSNADGPSDFFLHALTYLLTSNKQTTNTDSLCAIRQIFNTARHAGEHGDLGFLCFFLFFLFFVENDRRDRGVDVEYLPGILCAKLVICNQDDFSEAVVRNEKKKKKKR